jgi:predicted RNase H-like HicB family nuclease
MSPITYEGVASARRGLKGLLDAAGAGRPVGVQRDEDRFLVVDANRLRHFLASVGPRAQVVAENDGWSLFFPGLPIASDGDTLDAAIEDAIAALREYAEDWIDHLSTAPNHSNNWGLVQLVSVSSDEELTEWLVGFAPNAAAPA